MTRQIGTRDRVIDFGEVNYSEKEVNLDVGPGQAKEIERLDQIFLNLPGGDGNFLLQF